MIVLYGDINFLISVLNMVSRRLNVDRCIHECNKITRKKQKNIFIKIITKFFLPYNYLYFFHNHVSCDYLSIAHTMDQNINITWKSS